MAWPMPAFFSYWNYNKTFFLNHTLVPSCGILPWKRLRENLIYIASITYSSPVIRDRKQLVLIYIDISKVGTQKIFIWALRHNTIWKQVDKASVNSRYRFKKMNQIIIIENAKRTWFSLHDIKIARTGFFHTAKSSPSTEVQKCVKTDKCVLVIDDILGRRYRDSVSSYLYLPYKIFRISKKFGAFLSKKNPK